MTKLSQPNVIPPSVQPVQHNSGSIRTTPEGGEVSRDQYQRPAPPPPPAPTLLPRR
jgi:hypothetical protein